MTRACRECTLCCKLLPVRELAKPANTLCQHQRRSGCEIYRGEGFPPSCRIWSCHWLMSEDDLPRPDRAHCVIDPSRDFIELEVQGVRGRVGVVQVWCDPKFPAAHREPRLRAWLQRQWDEHKLIALVRFDSSNALALFPPNFPGNTDAQWFEKSGTGTDEHSPREIYEAFSGAAAQRAKA